MEIIIGKELARAFYAEDAEPEARALAKAKTWDKIDRIGVFPVDSLVPNHHYFELHIGTQFRRLSDQQKVDLKKTGKSEFQLGPGDSALVLTRQFLIFPADILGIVSPKVSFIWDGLSLPTTKIDPTWHGCLYVPVTNHTRKTIPLEPGRAFASVMIFRLPELLIQPTQFAHAGHGHLQSFGTRAKACSTTSPDAVISDEDFGAVVKEYGPPIDMVHAKIRTSTKEITKDISDNYLPKMREGLRAEFFRYGLGLAIVVITLLVGIIGYLIGTGTN